MTALPPHYKQELISDIAKASMAYDKGYNAGERVGEMSARKAMASETDRKIGIYFLIGVGIGGTLIAFFLGWPT